MNRRLVALLQAVDEFDPVGARVRRMSPATRAQYDQWRRCVDAEHEQFAHQPEGALFEALLEGRWTLPEPPSCVAEALDLVTAPDLTEGMSADAIEAAWSAMIGD